MNGTTSADVSYQYVWSASYIDAMVLRDQYANGTMQPNARLYTQYDANVNVTALIGFNASTQTWGVVQRFVYSPYGTATVLSPTWATTTDAFNWQYMHQGGRLDPATGLYLFRHRDYSPTLGNWIEQDPAGYVDGASRYQAYMSKPLDGTDPSGEGLWSWVGNTLVGAAVGFLIAGPPGMVAGGIAGGTAEGVGDLNNQFNGLGTFNPGTAAMTGGLSGASGGVATALEGVGASTPTQVATQGAIGMASGATSAAIASGGNPRKTVYGGLVGGAMGADGVSPPKGTNRCFAAFTTRWDPRWGTTLAKSEESPQPARRLGRALYFANWLSAFAILALALFVAESGRGASSWSSQTMLLLLAAQPQLMGALIDAIVFERLRQRRVGDAPRGPGAAAFKKARRGFPAIFEYYQAMVVRQLESGGVRATARVGEWVFGMLALIVAVAWCARLTSIRKPWDWFAVLDSANLFWLVVRIDVSARLLASAGRERDCASL